MPAEIALWMREQASSRREIKSGRTLNIDGLAGRPEPAPIGAQCLVPSGPDDCTSWLLRGTILLPKPRTCPAERLPQVAAEMNGGDEVQQVAARSIGILAPTAAMSSGNADAQRLTCLAVQRADTPIVRLSPAAREKVSNQSF
jgi:hypothetical protein